MVKERIFITDFECLSVPDPPIHSSPTRHLSRPYSKTSSIKRKPFLPGVLIGSLGMSMRLRMVLFIPLHHPRFIRASTLLDLPQVWHRTQHTVGAQRMFVELINEAIQP